MRYTVREARSEDWRSLRELRLAALRDPVASVAFFEPYQVAAELGRSDWERRATSSAKRATYVGVAEDGGWAGMLAVFEKERVARVVGVYLLPEHRGTGLGAQLLRSAIAWAGEREVRLHVHENNERAARFYAGLGFRPTGESQVDPRDRSLRAFELSLWPPAPDAG